MNAGPATSPGKRNTKQEMLAYLAKYPNGQPTSTVAMAMEMAPRQAVTRLCELEHSGRVVGIQAHIGSRQGKVWCLPEHEADARRNLHVHQARALATVWKVRKAVEMAPGQKERVKSSVGSGADHGAPKKPRKVICPHGVDMRFTVKAKDVQKHFSALPPGSYSAPASSWVDAVVTR